jgi:hypothetical protein
MAESNQISKDLVPQELLDRLTLLTTGIEKLYEANKKMVTMSNESEKANKKQSDSVDDLNKKSQEQAEKQKAQQAEQEKLQKLATEYNTTLKEASRIAQAKNVLDDESTGHVKKLTAEMSLLIIQRNNLSKADANYASTVDALNKKINAIGVEHKNLMSIREQDKINVGNYHSAVTGLIPGLDSVIAKVQSVGMATVEGFKNAGKGVVNFAKSFKTAGGAAESFGMITKAAMIGTGIGAIVIAIAALYEYFTRTAEGAKTLRQATAALGAIFEVIMGLLSKIGKILVDAFTHPMDSIKKLGAFIEENIMNRLKSFAVMGKAIMKIFSKDWKEGFKELADGALQLGTGVEHLIEKVVDAGEKLIKKMKDATTIALEYEEREHRLAQMKRDNLIEDAKLEQEVLKLREQSYDKTKSEQERIEALTKALELEGKMAEDQAKIKTESYNILMAKSRERAKNGLIDTQEEKDAIAEATKEIINVESDRINRSLRMEKQLMALRMSIAADAKKLAEEQAKFEEDLGMKSAASERDRLEIEYTNKIEKAMELGVDQSKVDAWYLQQVDELNKKEAAKLVGIWEKNANDKYKILELNNDKDKRLKEDALLKEINLQKEIIKAANLTTEEKEKALDNLAVFEATIRKKEVDDDKKAADLKLETQQHYFKASQKLLKDSEQLFNAISDRQILKLKSEENKKLLALDKEQKARIANGEDEKKVTEEVAAKKLKIQQATAKKEAEIKRKQAILDKAAAMVDIAINTAVAVSKLTKDSPMSIPLIAMAIAAGVVEEAIVAAKPLPEIPSFKKGTRSAPGGFSILHGGEMVELPGGGKYLTMGGVNDPISSILPAGAKVTPNDILMEQFRKMPKKNTDANTITEQALMLMLKELKKEKPVVQINADSDGLGTWAVAKQNRTHYLNNRFRGRV